MVINVEINFCNGNDKAYQALLNDLLKDIFLDFQFFYDLDLWDENYESYSIMEDDRIVSNICVYKTQVLFHGKQSLALSLGAVATRKGYRGRGYAKLLMDHILKKYNKVAMYLGANDSVTEFYPRFGFRRVYEKLPVADVTINNDIEPIFIPYNDPQVLDYIYHRINYSQILDCKNTQSINLFHIHLSFLNNSIYHIPELDTMFIAQQEDKVLKLIGVFSKKDITFDELASKLPFQGVERIEFGFMPYWEDAVYSMQDYETDPIFVKNITCDLGDFKFPELSIT